MSRKHGWVLALLAQIALLALLGICTGLLGLVLTGKGLWVVHRACMWLALPAVSGAWSLCVARCGFPAIFAWVPGPMAFVCSYWPVVGLPPAPGAVLLAMGVALVCACAGEVLRKRSKKER